MPASRKRSTNFASQASALRIGDTITLDVEAVVRDVRIHHAVIGSPEVHVLLEVVGTAPGSSRTLAFVWSGDRMVAVTKWAPAADQDFEGL